MLDIESNLRRDVSGNYRRELITKFTTASEEIRHELSKGLAPKKFEKMNRLLQAIEAGILIIREFKKSSKD